MECFVTHFTFVKSSLVVHYLMRQQMVYTRKYFITFFTAHFKLLVCEWIFSWLPSSYFLVANPTNLLIQSPMFSLSSLLPTSLLIGLLEEYSFLIFLVNLIITGLTCRVILHNFCHGALVSPVRN